jgi:hypothetical protein
VSDPDPQAVERARRSALVHAQRRALFDKARAAAPDGSPLKADRINGAPDVVAPGAVDDESGKLTDVVTLEEFKDGDQLFVSSTCGHGIIAEVARRPPDPGTRGGAGLPLIKIGGQWQYTCPLCRTSITEADWRELGLPPPYEEEDDGSFNLNSDSDDVEDESDASDGGIDRWVEALPAALRDRYDESSGALRYILHEDGLTESFYDGDADNERLVRRTISNEQGRVVNDMIFEGERGSERLRVLIEHSAERSTRVYYDGDAERQRRVREIVVDDQGRPITETTFAGEAGEDFPSVVVHTELNAEFRFRVDDENDMVRLVSVRYPETADRRERTVVLTDDDVDESGMPWSIATYMFYRPPPPGYVRARRPRPAGDGGPAQRQRTRAAARSPALA